MNKSLSFRWRRHPDLNWGSEFCRLVPYHLAMSPQCRTLVRHCVFLARVAGFEPANDGIRIRCLTAWLYPISKIDSSTFFLINQVKNELGWMVGFEPTNTGATTQGLNHLTTPTIFKLICKKKWRPGTGSNRRPPA